MIIYEILVIVNQHAFVPAKYNSGKSKTVDDILAIVNQPVLVSLSQKSITLQKKYNSGKSITVYEVLVIVNQAVWASL